MAINSEEKDAISYVIAQEGYEATVFDNTKFADFFWNVIQEMEGKYADSKTDSSESLDGGNAGNAKWSWSNP